ncbi:putative holin-like toxin [Desulforamulus ruminis]|uniref:Uncharacterized protein n=1 Tax=Desulforamulus ruminis (strain ATCC 23193 / DSM 2154 / NCIMB 8452 / DL) TaxID=696281 RepID=F6DUU4_DESRL|nr:putative holin-like toxin [Desulforamulus ruminis]AEG60232.1 hypothetical protein Desru_1976 [Desulforamulus ruminis DSM 2154]
MTAFEALLLMLTFGILMVAMLSHDRKKQTSFEPQSKEVCFH